MAADRAADGQAAKLKVFISYSRADEAFADELRLGLEDKGYPVAIDKHAIRQGEEWKPRLAKLIAENDTVVFVLSPDSARSDICDWEVEEAYRQAKRIIPVMHRGLDESPKGQQRDGTPWPPGPVTAPARLTLINYPRFDGGRSFMTGLRQVVEALEADHDWIDRHSRLAARARDWDEGGRPTNRLMSGADIAEAKRLIETRKASAPPMLAVQMDFIQASEAHEAAQTSARERELEEKQRLTEQALTESRRAEQASRRAVRIAWAGRTARLWRVFLTPQSLVNPAKNRAARCLTQKQRAQYFLPPAPPTWCVERRLWPYHTDDWQAWLPKQRAYLASGRQGDAPALPKAE